MNKRHDERPPGSGRSDPGVASRWLFHYHPDMVAASLRAATPVPRMTIPEPFMQAHVHHWAPDLLEFPLFSPGFCRLLLDAAAALDDEDPDLPLDQITPRLSEVITELVGRHVNPILHRVFMGMHTIAQVHTPRLIRRAADSPAAADPRVQVERGGNVGFIVSLSRAHTGGGLRFPRQAATLPALEVGHALLIPSGPTHWFERLPVSAGVEQTLAFKTRSSDDND